MHGLSLIRVGFVPSSSPLVRPAQVQPGGDDLVLMIVRCRSNLSLLSYCTGIESALFWLWLATACSVSSGSWDVWLTLAFAEGCAAGSVLSPVICCCGRTAPVAVGLGF